RRAPTAIAATRASTRRAAEAAAPARPVPVPGVAVAAVPAVAAAGGGGGGGGGVGRPGPPSAWGFVAAGGPGALCSLGSGASRAVAATVIAPRAFPSPEAAATAFVEALRADDLKTMAAILGSSAQRLISSGDPVADNDERERFVKAYDEAHTLVADGNTM